MTIEDIFLGEDPSTEVVPTSGYSPAKNKYMKDSLIPYLESPTATYTGPKVAGASNLQSLSLAGLEGLAGDANNFLKPAGEGGGGLSPEFEDFFRANVADPLKRQFEEDILPAIGRQYSGQSYGSERAAVENRAARDYVGELSGQRSKAVFNERNRYQEMLFKLLEAGAVPREIENDRLQADYNEFLRQQKDAATKAELGVGLLQQPDIENTVIHNEGSPGILEDTLTGVVGDIAGGIGGEVADHVVDGVTDYLFPAAGAAAAGTAGAATVGAGTAGTVGAGVFAGGGAEVAGVAGAEVAGTAGAGTAAGGAGADVLGTAAAGEAGGVGGLSAGAVGLGIAAAGLIAVNVLNRLGAASDEKLNARAREYKRKRLAGAAQAMSKNMATGKPPMTGFAYGEEFAPSALDEDGNRKDSTIQDAGYYIPGSKIPGLMSEAELEAIYQEIRALPAPAATTPAP